MHPALLLILKATLLLAAALIIDRVLSKVNPRWRMFACQTAAVAVLLLPLATLIPVKIPIFIGTPTEAPMVPTTSAEAIGFATADAVPAPEIVIGSKESMAANAATASRNSFLSSLPLPSPIHWLIIVYIAGIAALLIRLAVGTRRLRQSLAALPHARPEMRRRFREIAMETGLSDSPQLKVAPGLVSPFCVGGTSPAVVIPASLTEATELDTLDFVLRHELHHIANGDLRRAILIGAVTTLLWFHPLAWLLRRQHSEAMEELGDRVAAGDDPGRKRYRSMLAGLALEMTAPRPRAVSTLGLLRTPEIVVRLRRLSVNLPHTPLAKTPTTVLVLAIVLPLFLTLAQVEPVRAHVGRATATSIRPSLIDSLPAEDKAKATASIHRGLAALLATEDKNGGYPNGREGQPPSNGTGRTALAGIAFLAHGGAAEGSPYHESTRRCIDYLLDAQDDATGLFDADRKGARGSLYNHTTAATFLGVALPDLRGERAAQVRKSLEGALEVLIKAQAVPKAAASQGGWRYTSAAKDSDLSCTVWALRALWAIDDAGIAVPEKIIADAIAYVERAQNENGGFAYTTPGGGLSSTALTAAGLYCLHKAGKGETEAATKAVKTLLTQLDTPSKHYEFYSLMWAAFAMGERGGEDAKTFSRRLVAHCSKRQTEAGGWPSPFGEAIAICYVAIAYGNPL